MPTELTPTPTEPSPSPQTLLDKLNCAFRAVRGLFVGATPPAPTPELTPDHCAWVLGVVGHVMRKPIAGQAHAAIPDFAHLQEKLASLGVGVQEISFAAWQDESQHGGPALELFIGAKVGLVLGRRGTDNKVLVAYAGEQQPVALTEDELAPLLKASRLYRLTARDPAIPMEEAYGWRWFAKAFVARRGVVWTTLIASLVIQLIALAFPLATQAIVDKVITNQAMSTLIALGVGIGLFAFFNAGMGWLRQKVLLRLANVVDAELSGRVMAHLFNLPLRFFEGRATGALITRIHGVERVREFASGAFLLVALELPFMLVFLLLMVSYSVALSAVVLGFLTFMLGLSFACGPRLRELANKQFEAGARVQGFITEQVSAHETIKSLQMEPQVRRRFGELNQVQLDAALRLREFGNTYGTTMQFAEQLMNISVLCLGAWLAMTGPGLTIGMLVAFQMFAQRVAQPLLKLSGMWQDLQQVRIAVAQLGDVMSTPTERYGELPTSSGTPRGAIELEGLGFRHSPDRQPLYKDLSLKIEPGQVVLISGPSGCGKSTLVKILLGLYPAYEGLAKLDGRDIRSMTVNELRSYFGVVPQETVLFAGTIADNLMQAVPGVSFEQVVQACKMAGIHEAIENLPQGYQTVVGERGVGLSGGQKQRLGVARALLKRPRVLIFDEATSGLDEASAEHIGETVNRLRGKATVLFVAHKVPRCLSYDGEVRL